MALTVTLDNNRAAPNDCVWTLKADSVEHAGQRPGAIAAALPAEYVLFLDLGMNIERITVAGTCESGAVAGVCGTGNPSKLDLRAIFKDWYENATSNMIKLTLNANETYSGGIQNYSFHQEAAKEDRWTYSFTFVVYAKV